MVSSSSISLYELNRQIKESLHQSFISPVWVRAEINQYNEHYSGHCYLELVEKEPEGDNIRASVKATIWASAFRRIKAYFETSTGQALSAGMKVLVRVHVDFHEVYGISLNVRDIDPNYTLGDLARKRREILKKLEETGVMDMNKELPLTRVPQKIAIISSSTAAGYEDFCKQMLQNKNKIHYYLKLFPASMQGSSVPESVIAALDKIAGYEDLFDAVVLIRGGGSKTDLSHFDNFDLAYYIAQFPIPVITGIGHERDDSVIDFISHTRCKTPTATASLLLEMGAEFESELDWFKDRITTESKLLVSHEQEYLKELSGGISQMTKMYMEQLMAGQREYIIQTESVTKQYLQKLIFSLQRFGDSVILTSRQFVNRTQLKHDKVFYQIGNLLRRQLENEKHKLSMHEKDAEFANPVNILKKGYSVSIYKGKPIKDSSELNSGEIIETRVYKGRFKSQLID